LYFDEAPKNNRLNLFDFDKQLHALVRLLRGGTRLTRIEGLRRTGKTSLLLTALNETGLPHVVIDGREKIWQEMSKNRELGQELNGLTLKDI